MTCRSCSSDDLELILDLGMHAWCNNFLSKNELGTEKTYPLRLVYCYDCSLTQLDFTVPKERMFSNHDYVSGTTKTLAKHFLSTASYLTKKYSINRNDLILDIGGNDGTNLLQFEKIGLKNTLNVESATNISNISKLNGITTHNEFFNKEYIDNYNLKNKVKLITANGVFFHLEELHSVIEGIYDALTQDGLLTIQFMYLGDMIKKISFDGIYHEHLCYYSLESLNNLMSPHGFSMIDCCHSEIHGGSYIVTFEKDKDRFKFLPDLLCENINLAKLRPFADEVKQYKKLWQQKLSDQQNLYALGAPAKGNTWLTYLGIDNSIIKNIFEVNDMKIGKYTPVTHIPIIKESYPLDVEPYSKLLLLSWNFADEIKTKHMFNNLHLDFIEPFE